MVRHPLLEKAVIRLVLLGLDFNEGQRVDVLDQDINQYVKRPVA